MNFSDIKFYERGGSKAPGLGLRLRGYWVHKTHFELAWKLLLAANPALQWQGEQTTVTLCNDPDWQYRKPGVRHKLGRCVRFFAESRMLPLRISNPGKGGPRKYLPTSPTVVAINAGNVPRAV